MLILRLLASEKSDSRYRVKAHIIIVSPLEASAVISLLTFSSNLQARLLVSCVLAPRYHQLENYIHVAFNEGARSHSDFLIKTLFIHCHASDTQHLVDADIR